MIAKDCPECEIFKTINPRKYDICRGAANLPLDGPNSINAYRRAAGFQPLAIASGVMTQPSATPRETSQKAAWPCMHRGEKIRDDESNLCGSRGEQISIFACAKHGECSLARYCQKQTVRQCNKCQDRKVPPIAPPFPQDRRGGNPFSYRASGTPEFVTLERLQWDVRTLASMIPPETSRIIGVARSGVLPASLVAMLLHLPLSIVRQSAGDLVDGGNGWRLTGNTGGQGPPVVIDDTVMSGNSFKQVMPIVWKDFPKAVSAAVYVNPAARMKPDMWARDLPHPHLLEWNLMNSIFSPQTAVDFDGILCADCAPQDDDDGERYRGFLLSATPKYMIRKTRIPLIVTARLERWRPETEQWLAWHGMAADQIIMGPWASNAERARSDVGGWKGQHFHSFMQRRHRIKPSLFIESEERQARRIAEVSGGLVVCPAAGRCF